MTTLAGSSGMSGTADGTGAAAARFNEPAGVAVDHVGNVYVADEFNSTIRKVTASGVVTTLAGAAGMPGGVDGGSAARFTFPSGVAVDGAGTVYVAASGSVRDLPVWAFQTRAVRSQLAVTIRAERYRVDHV